MLSIEDSGGGGRGAVAVCVRVGACRFRNPSCISSGQIVLPGTRGGWTWGFGIELLVGCDEPRKKENGEQIVYSGSSETKSIEPQIFLEVEIFAIQIYQQDKPSQPEHQKFLLQSYQSLQLAAIVKQKHRSMIFQRIENFQRLHVYLDEVLGYVLRNGHQKKACNILWYNAISE